MLPRLHMSDIVLIAASVLIAYFIWLIARTGNVEERVVEDVPVVLDLPPFLEAELSHKVVDVSIRYPTGVRSRITNSAFMVRISGRDQGLVSQAGVREPQAVTIPVITDDVLHTTLTASVEVLKVEPVRITAYVKYRVALARIIAPTEGQPAPTYRCEEPIVTPPERLITGPPDVLNGMERDRNGFVTMWTNPVSLAGKRDSFTTSSLIAVPDEISVLDEETRQRLPRDSALAIVQVVIKEEETSRSISQIPIQAPLLTSNLIARFEPTSGSVTIKGPRSRVESLDPRMVLLRPKEKP
ncbi:hypothetical protein FJY63_02930, partial [Candidatus Sumerlaeota bacterium]|nr:hypothetical protein [Candidatus Sumerlaeota bacterium]